MNAPCWFLPNNDDDDDDGGDDLFSIFFPFITPPTSSLESVAKFTGI